MNLFRENPKHSFNPPVFVLETSYSNWRSRFSMPSTAEIVPKTTPNCVLHPNESFLCEVSRNCLFAAKGTRTEQKQAGSAHSPEL